MAHETVPADIDRAIVRYMTAVKSWAQASFGKREAEFEAVQPARAALDAAILHHLRNADEMKAALERIEQGA